MDNKKCLLVKNLYNYDKIYAPPKRLDSNIDTIYITDDISKVDEIYHLGWSKVLTFTKHLNINDSFERRKIIAYINCFPEKIFPELLIYNYIYICDSNVVLLDTNYHEFVEKCNDNYALFCTSGWYRGADNNIIRELERSLLNNRWSYNFNQITLATNKYYELLKNSNIKPESCPVISAKYIGWNIKHKMKEEISNFVYTECLNHLQGNIILSVAVCIYSQNCLNYTGFLNDGSIGHHIQNY